MLYGRDARLPLGIEQKEITGKPTHGPAKYLEELKKRQVDLRNIVVEKLKKAQEKQKHDYDSKYRSRQSKSLNIGDTVLLKNFRARGLQQKFVGPYLIVGIREGNCEIESLVDKKRKVVHFNSLKPFKIDYEFDDIEQDENDLCSEESESEVEEFAFEPPIRLGRNIERDIEPVKNRPYDLRRNRRRPERYGVPVMEY